MLRPAAKTYDAQKSETTSNAASAVILIVDDEQFMLEFFRTILQKAGYSVVQAADGNSAVSLFREFSPDLVLLDLVMPGKDGFATCQEIRSLPGGLRTPILMVPGLDDAPSINRAFDAGATDFITKPVVPDLLTYRLRYMLRASRNVKSLAESEAKLAEAQRVAMLGNWEWEPATGDFRGSEETFRILGFPNRPVLFSYSSLLIAVSPSDRERADAQLRSVATETGSCVFECRLGDGGATSRLVRIQAWGRQFDPEKKRRIMGTIHDITELKKAENRLILLKEAVDSLPSGLRLPMWRGRSSTPIPPKPSCMAIRPENCSAGTPRTSHPIVSGALFRLPG